MRIATVLIAAVTAAVSDPRAWTSELRSGLPAWSDVVEITASPQGTELYANNERREPTGCGSRAARPAANDSLLRLLREGGLVMVLRHSITDHSRPDAKTISRTDRATQRNLSEAGIEQARRLGDAIRALQVPVDTVYSSPLFRTMDTARNAFGRAEPSEALWREGTAADRKRLVSEPPRAGRNRVLVTHNFVLISTFPDLGHDAVREGDAIIVRPLGAGRFDMLGRFPFDAWRRLADTEGAKPDYQ